MYPLQRLWHFPIDMWNRLPLRIDLPIPYLQIDVVFVNDPDQIKVGIAASFEQRTGRVRAKLMTAIEEAYLHISAYRSFGRILRVGGCTRCRLGSNQDGYALPVLCTCL